MKRRLHVVAEGWVTDELLVRHRSKIDETKVVNAPEGVTPTVIAQQTLPPGKWEFIFAEFVELEGQESLL